MFSFYISRIRDEKQETSRNWNDLLRALSRVLLFYCIYFEWMPNTGDGERVDQLAGCHYTPKNTVTNYDGPETVLKMPVFSTPSCVKLVLVCSGDPPSPVEILPVFSDDVERSLDIYKIVQTHSIIAPLKSIFSTIYPHLLNTFT